MAKTSNMFDYLDWRGDLSFRAAPFNEVDNLILSVTAFVNFSPSAAEGETAELKPAVAEFAALPEEKRYLGAIIPPQITDVAVKASQCKRFEGTLVRDFVNTVSEKDTEQFSAVTFLLPDGSVFVAYRGTDDTLTGWKEDLMIGLKNGVPAQLRAAEYLCRAADRSAGPIRVGGHSKGGNLAVWAAVNAPDDVAERIVAVYSNDGPGFLSDFTESASCRRMEDRIINLVPESSIVGALLQRVGKYRVIASSQKNIMQHDPLSWEVKADRFVDRKSRTKFGSESDKAIRSWIDSMSEDEKKDIADTLFAALDATGAKTVTDLKNNPLRSAMAMQKAFNSTDREKREKVNGLVKRLFRLK